MILHDLQQGSDEWHAFRRTHRGASEAAAMLGLSSKMSLSELLHLKYTGIEKEHSEFVLELFLDGHEEEAKARRIMEEVVGQEIYPAVFSLDDEGNILSASCDGLTLDGTFYFEHKLWNEKLAASVRAGIVPDEYMAQCQQILLVTKAASVRLNVSDGTRDRNVWVDVYPDESWFARIMHGWEEFEIKLANYVPPENQPIIVAEPVKSLPSVSVQITGQVIVKENFNVFEAALREFLAHDLIRKPQTDQDFADLDAQIKDMKKAESMLSQAEDQIIAQIKSVDDAKRQKDMLLKLVKDNRLMAEKLMDSEKARRKSELVSKAHNAFDKHIEELQRGIVGVQLNVVMPDFSSPIKGLKTLDSMQNKIDAALTFSKFEASAKAEDIVKKLAWLNENASDFSASFYDMQQLIEKPMDDFQLAVHARIAAQKNEEKARIEKMLEAERAKIMTKVVDADTEEERRRVAVEDARKVGGAYMKAPVVFQTAEARTDEDIVRERKTIYDLIYKMNAVELRELFNHAEKILSYREKM